MQLYSSSSGLTNKNGTLYTDYRKNISRRVSKVVQRQYVETTWSTQKHHIGQRTPVYSRVNEGVKQDIGDQKQDVNYVTNFI